MKIKVYITYDLSLQPERTKLPSGQKWTAPPRVLNGEYQTIPEALYAFYSRFEPWEAEFLKQSYTVGVIAGGRVYRMEGNAPVSVDVDSPEALAWQKPR